MTTEDFPPRVSPDGRFRITIEMVEAFNSHWLMMPTLAEVATDAILFKAVGRWSLDESEWTGDSEVTMRMRKYPGNHEPPDLLAKIDCETRTARIGDGKVIPVAELEAALDASLRWIHGEVRAERTLQQNVRQALRKLFGR